MKGKDFIKRIRQLAKDRGVPFNVTSQGKGSHSTVFYGDRRTTVKHREIGEGLLHTMLRQLGLTKDDLQ